MIGSRSKSPLFLAAGVLVATVIGGCSTREPDLENGRNLFAVQCGTCHALAEAQTAATIGPDLDAAFAESRATGMDRDTFAGVVQQQIAAPRAVDPSDTRAYMPAELVTGDDADDVAAYVGSVAGVPGIQPPAFEAEAYFAQSCGSCHVLGAASTTGTTGPDLDETLPDKDEQFILESIVDPSAEIADGFADGIMPPNYGDQLTEAQLDELTKYIAGAIGQTSGDSP